MPVKIDVVGRPPAYKDSSEMQDRINQYFEDPPTKKHTTKEGDSIDVPFLSITGLALWLGFESRQSFYDYEKKEEFTYTIKRARALIENEYEFMLQKGNTAGAIFALKNFGWDDKRVIENNITGSVKNFNDMYANT
tara:strand:- start:4909 stop:5316 length:408 start_codon:yes stop_codon:yes gene_type:complete